jgi:putative hydrolase of the HAD superfamily
MIQALLFDLDDTLYPEKDFVSSGFRAVARHIEEHYYCAFDLAFSTMMAAFEAQGREGVFPALLVRFPNTSVSLDELVNVYRQHTPAISLFPGYLELLKELSVHYRLGVITDGLPAVQKRKVRSLGIGGIMNKILYTWEYGSDKQKPHPLSFSLMLESLRVEPDSALFIGDNPDKDCRGAHGAGIKFAEVRHAESKRTASDSELGETPEYILDSLLKLPRILKHMNQG